MASPLGALSSLRSAICRKTRRPSPHPGIRFDCDGAGEVLLEAGAFVHQPPGLRHVEIAHSDDVEVLEITLAAEFETEAVAAPEGPEAKAAGTPGE